MLANWDVKFLSTVKFDRKSRDFPPKLSIGPVLPEFLAEDIGDYEIPNPWNFKIGIGPPISKFSENQGYTQEYCQQHQFHHNEGTCIHSNSSDHLLSFGCYHSLSQKSLVSRKHLWFEP
jgi:hypothetical protein